MMNAWGDLIKTEPNIAGMGGGGGGVGLVVQQTSNPNVNSMYDNDSNLIPSQNGPAAVAAAVATAAMMMSSSGMQQAPNSYSNTNVNHANMMMNGHIDDNCNLDDDDTMDNDDDDCNSSVNNDAEGVWSPDIEQSFQEALAIYPPCGRRKIILSEEGKMYGRNELIARYIKVRTGKSRSRKQVSSHIQVLAKRKTKDFHNNLKDGKDGKLGTNGAFPNPFSHLTSAQIISPAPIPLPPQQSHIIATNPGTNQAQLMTNPNLSGSLPPSVPLNPTTNLSNTPQQLVINPRNNPNGHHQSQLLQNCTNLLPNNPNNNGIQSQSCIWSHPGLQPEKKARILNTPSSSSLPCSTSSSSSSTNSNEDLIPSGSSTSSSQNNENNRNLNHHHHHHHNHHTPHHNHHHHSQHQPHTQQIQSVNTNTNNNNTNHHHSSLSPPDSISPQNQWITNYNNNNNNNIMSNKSIIGMQQLRLIEFSGFIEQRNDPELYHKHLFVHLNTSDYNLFNCFNNKNDKPNELDDFETINYKEFADKFPENDLFWSLSTNNEKPSSSSTSSSSSTATTSSSTNSAAYLIKFWVDLNYSLEDGINSIYAVTNIFESAEPITISCSTKVCSFGNQVVEKVETEHGRYESNGKYVYRIEGSPMCEYMITFINKLKQLPEKSLQNSVLENFSVLQLIKNHDTQELLLSLAYVFEVSTSEHGAQHVVYKLSNK